MTLARHRGACVGLAVAGALLVGWPLAHAAFGPSTPDEADATSSRDDSGVAPSQANPTADDPIAAGSGDPAASPRPTNALQPTPAELAPADTPVGTVPPGAAPSGPVEVESTPATPDAESTDLPGPIVLDRVLDSGVRLITAQDDTLPVAAVVLAVETGTEDDPPAHPGLIHALAYHLWQGNRELAPWAASELLHARGATTEFAVGPGQVRFESLVPAATLDEALWIEGQRLRAPTLNEPLWERTLRDARRDVDRRWSVPPAARAAAHGVAALVRDGRDVPPELDDIPLPTVARRLARQFAYPRATLVVVGPLPPDELAERATSAFAGLPPRARSVPHRRSQPTARQVAVEHPGKGKAVVWAVPGDPRAQSWARAWCRALAQQRREADEPPKARLRCAFDGDPRRPLMTVRVFDHDDPRGFLAARLQRLQTSDATLLQAARQAIAERLAYDLRLPLPLARVLAGSPPREPQAPARSARAARTGVVALASERPVWTPDPDAAVLLVPGAAPK